MIAWIVLVVAVLIAVVLLSFCAYEITWKSRRLQGDLARLQSVRSDLARVQTDLVKARARAQEMAARQTTARGTR